MNSYIIDEVLKPVYDPSSEWPKISIVMPSFNQGEFIRESIDSVLNQNYPNLELIIVDGGSTDDTIEILKNYNHIGIKWISEPDEGQSDALNKGFSLATGEIFGWLNSDDLYTNKSFYYVIDAFKSNSNKSVFFGDYHVINDRTEIIEYVCSFDFNVNHFFYEGFFINAQAMFWTSKIHRDFGKFDVKLNRTMDYDFILRLGILGEDIFFRLNNIALGSFRIHEKQKTKGFDDTVIKEHRWINSKTRKISKYSQLGLIIRKLYRLRRFYWYIKRIGLKETGYKVLKKFDV